ncbi:hypothetical protein CANARDRAFT_23566 [[Candida] arabinofermentans NRRL YB-2248]|uniref:Protein kinase domain-containing protein n=1 Tax=[Candida] arabinofermentans NRRL YB-2248 TaxID=983967 RepID=A0A1E4SZX5_9ASCO|nr:hypothetical protein CANARDRAFT_23566 [[Candida] arabinofermentans NRRL YB-2248]
MINNYNFNELIGEGTFGNVYSVVEENGDKLAMKIMKKNRLVQHNVPHSTIYKEAKLLFKSRHCGKIITFHDFFEDNYNYYIVTEQCHGSDLFEKLMKVKKFDENSAQFIIKQILQALVYMHQRGIIHRDIKLENIVFKNQHSNEIRVIDMGLAREIAKTNNKCYGKSGTLGYMAPEVFLEGDIEAYSYNADIWSLGVVAFILLTGYIPVTANNDMEGYIRDISNRSFPNFPSKKQEDNNTSEIAKDFVKQCLQINPDKRIEAVQLLMNHPWMCKDVLMSSSSSSNKLVFKPCSPSRKLFPLGSS